jgi:hypothetical protein
MLRLSRPIAGLLATTALLSGLSVWQGYSDGERTAPLSVVGDWVQKRVSDVRPIDESRPIAAQQAITNKLEELTVAVAEGRVSLVDGAERLRGICCEIPTFSWGRFREVTPGATDEERWRRALIARVAYRLKGDEERARMVVARLGAELEEQSR